jgi:hypothetical protein
MKHSGALSVIVFAAGYLTGIALICQPELYLIFGGATMISYLTFILSQQFEEE